MRTSQRPTTRADAAGIENVDGALAVAARLLCFGLAGLWWSRPGARRRRALCRARCTSCRRAQRRSRTVLFTVAAILAAFAVVPVLSGQLWNTSKCLTIPSGDPMVRGPLRYVVTSPPSGAALLYVDLLGADVCTSPDDMLVADMQRGPIPRAGVAIGDVYITQRQGGHDLYSLAALSHHESVHSLQWAVSSLLAGPTAFPTAYGAVELVLPGSQNPFERQAGLAAGGYDVPDAIEVLWVGVVAWVAVAAGVVLVRYRRRGSHDETCPLRRRTSRHGADPVAS